MRTLTAQQQAAIGSGQPALSLELIDWALHYSAVFTGGPAGRQGAALAPDGSLVQAYSDLAGNVYVRRVTNPALSSWGSWTTLSTTANTSGVVYVCNTGSSVRCLWPNAATTQLYYSDSTDNGQTWSAAAVLFDPGATVTGIAADRSTTLVFVQYLFAANTYRVAAWSYSGGSWSKADWGLGDAYAGGGIGVVNISGGTYLLLASAAQATSTSGTAVSLTFYNAGVWSTLVTVVPADLAAGLTLQDPRLGLYDGLYHLAYSLVDSGATSGISGSRTALAHSFDGVHWTDPLEDGNTYNHGATPVKHTAGYLLAAPDTSALAPLYTGSASQYRDCSADLLSIKVDQKDGHAAQLTATLMNDAGQYTSLACLRPNARLRLSLGYASGGTVYTHMGYVASWTFERAADESRVVVAQDARSFLARQSRTALRWSNQTIDYLTREMLARAGLLSYTLPTTSQFSQVVPNFEVTNGTPWLSALTRLATIYGYDVAARTNSDGTDTILVAEKSPSDASVWSYGDELDVLEVAHSGDRANHILVYGQPGTTAIVGEAWDFTDAESVGQERYLHVVEPQITTRTAAGIRASLELNTEKRRALAGRLSGALHPGLELWDVVTCSDAVLPSTSVRLSALLHMFDALSGAYELVCDLEGV